MKNLCLSFLLFYSLASCQQTLNEQNLVGTWRITGYSTSADLSMSIIRNAERIAKTNVYKFDADGSFNFVDEFTPNGKSGMWKINSDLSQIELLFNDNQNGNWRIYKVISFSKLEMVWVYDMGSLGNEEMILKKDQ